MYELKQEMFFSVKMTTVVADSSEHKLATFSSMIKECGTIGIVIYISFCLLILIMCKFHCPCSISHLLRIFCCHVDNML